MKNMATLSDRQVLCVSGMAVLLFTLTACALSTETDGSSPIHDIRVSTLPPTDKSVINAMLLSAKIPLRVDRSCHGVGTSFSDVTLGEYLSGFLAELNDPEGHNYVQVEIAPDARTADDGWLARVWLGKSQGEDEWAWGVEFFIRAQDGVVDSASYRCIGGG
jgi:hypothetical protein